MQQYRNLFHRFGKIIPLVGIFWVLANAGPTLKRKGYLWGSLDVLLDICPVVCIIKAVIESYKGDLIPAQTQPVRARLRAVTVDA
jgi:hypothetical protein